MSALRVTAVLPVKELSQAKSRLDLPGPARSQLAMAFAIDTLTAVLGADGVEDVVVVTPDPVAGGTLCALAPERVRVAPDGGSGLGGAVRRGVLVAHSHRPGSTVCVVPADLPCLRPVDVDTVLAAARSTRGAFVPDRTGHGTTLLVLPPEHAVVERYGPGSAARHTAAGLVPLAGMPPRARLDVDQWADLLRGRGWRLGAATTRACTALGLDSRDERDAS